MQGYGSTIFAEMTALAIEHGALNLGQGFPDTDGPPEVLAAAVGAIHDGFNQYPPGPGHAVLRESVARHQRRFYGLTHDPDAEVLITAGASAPEDVVQECIAYLRDRFNAEIREGRLQRWIIEAPCLTRSIHLARSGRRPMTKAAGVIHDLVRETLLDLARSGRWIGARISAPDGAANRNEEGTPGNTGPGDAGLPEALGPAVRRTAGVSSRRRQP